MVVADAESSAPTRKRPRLSLKYSKGGPMPVPNSSQDIETEEHAKNEEEPMQELSALGENASDVEEAQIVPAVASLQNLGNTCFLNSIMQVLRYTPGFLKRLEQLYQDIVFVERLKKEQAAAQEDGNSSENTESVQTIELVKHMMTLYKNMDKREQNHSEKATSDVMSMALKPQRILNTLREINPMFEGNLQHDAQELLRCILCYLQDAEKELEKIKSSLPPSALPQTSGPSNPIMQRFLSAGKKGGIKQTRESPRKASIKVEVDDGFSASVLCRRPINVYRKPDILDQIEQSEAAKTKVTELSAPAEADTPNDINNSNIKQENVIIIDEKDGIMTSKENKSQSENNAGSKKRSRVQKANSKMKTKRNAKVCNGKLEDKETKNESESSAKCKENGVHDEIDGEVDVNSKRMKKKESAILKPEVKVGSRKASVKPVDKSQRSLLGMLQEQVCYKRLGMRGAVLKKNTDSSKIDNDVDIQMAGAKNQQESINTEDSLKNQEVDISDEDNEDRKSRDSVMDSPRRMVLKLEKCDHVCNSPQKTVNANYATMALSPYKTSSAAYNSKVLNGPNSVKHKLDFSEEPKKMSRMTCQTTSCNGSDVTEDYLRPPQVLQKRNRKDFVEKLFMGSMMLRTKCLECENSREKIEEFHDISVPVRNEAANDSDEDDSDDEIDADSCLKKLMEAFTEVERLKDDNKYYCDKCFRLVEAERSLHYEVLPDILTLHLKRFSTSSGLFGYVSKINDHISIPLALPCLRYKCPSPCSRPDHRYMLYAIVTHAGVTLSSGHYLAYVRATKHSKPSNQNLQHKISSSQISLSSCNTVSASRGQKSVISTPGKEYLNQWIECDDETVRTYSEEQFCKMLKGTEDDGSLLGTPYVLFYHRAVPTSEL